MNLRDELKKQAMEDDLPAGHVKRFALRLGRELHLEKSLWKFQRLAIAASVIAFLGIGLVIYSSIEHFNQSGMIFSGLSPELYETEIYLQHEISQKLEYISTLQELNEDVLSDIQEIDESFGQIENDLKKNPRDERIISAVIETYQIKIELLDEIINKLQSVSEI